MLFKLNQLSVTSALLAVTTLFAGNVSARMPDRFYDVEPEIEIFERPIRFSHETIIRGPDYYEPYHHHQHHHHRPHPPVYADHPSKHYRLHSEQTLARLARLEKKLHRYEQRLAELEYLDSPRLSRRTNGEHDVHLVVTKKKQFSEHTKPEHFHSAIYVTPKDKSKGSTVLEAVSDAKGKSSAAPPKQLKDGHGPNTHPHLVSSVHLGTAPNADVVKTALSKVKVDCAPNQCHNFASEAVDKLTAKKGPVKNGSPGVANDAKALQNHITAGKDTKDFKPVNKHAEGVIHHA